MEMYQDGVRVWCLPDSAHCRGDELGRSPLDIGDDECPLGCLECSGMCEYYEE